MTEKTDQLTPDFFYYRLKLNKESTIKIAATDPDDDYVKCGESVFVESGVLAEKGHKLPGVTIEEVRAIVK